MTERPSIRRRLARPFDPAELRRIKRLWVRHSIAEDARDIDGLIATLSRRLRLRDRPDRPALGGPRRRAGLLRGAVRGVPGQRLRAVRDRHRAAGRVRGRDADRHEPRSVGGRRAVRAGRLARGPDPLPVGSRHGTVHRGADLVRPRARSDADGPVAPRSTCGPIIGRAGDLTGTLRGNPLDDTFSPIGPGRGASSSRSPSSSPRAAAGPRRARPPDPARHEPGERHDRHRSTRPCRPTGLALPVRPRDPVVRHQRAHGRASPTSIRTRS